MPRPWRNGMSLTRASRLILSFAVLMLAAAAASGADAPRLPPSIKPGPKVAATPPENVEFIKEIVYGKGGERDLMLNLSRPKNMIGVAPCVILIHGGGWSGGNRDQLNEATWLGAARGYVSAT